MRFCVIFGDFLHDFLGNGFIYIISVQKKSFFFNIFVFLQEKDVNLILRVWNNYKVSVV